MISRQFLSRRRALVKRVVSILSISLAVSLTGCSSQGLSFDNIRPTHYADRGNPPPIPSEPVYGYPDGYASAAGHYGAPFRTAAADPSYTQASVERTALAPVQHVSYGGSEPGGYVGNSYALQPVGAYDDRSSASSRASGPRYAQASGSRYDDRGSTAYQPSYSDYKPYRRRYTPPVDYQGAADPDYNSGPGSAYRSNHSSDHDNRYRDGHGSHHGGDDYIVAEGDTLYGIAKRFGLTTVALAELNGIIGSTIYVGQRLKISGNPKFTAANRYGNRHESSSRYVTEPSYPSENHNSNSDADDDRNAPPPGYSNEQGSRYEDSQYGEHKRGHGQAYSGSDEAGDRYEKRRYSYGEEPRIKKSEEKYARAYDEPSHDSRGDQHPPRYRKDKDAYFTYSVERGDTLFEIARRHRLSHRELAAYNDIPLSATLYPGQVLHIPKGRGYEPGGAPQDSDRGEDADRDERASPRDYNRDGYSRRVPFSQKKQERNSKDGSGKRELAKADAAEPGGRAAAKDAGRNAKAAANKSGDARPILAAHSDVEPKPASSDSAQASGSDCKSLSSEPAARSASTFREPVEGLIVSKFGSSDDGAFNDGIDFSVPKGTPVKAAENGVVAYTGNELPGFGNLILVRHADGYVTAYAHNDQLLVSRCDVVKRGQEIAKAGATGKVTKPQLHFEVRKDSKPVDPEAYFSRS